MHLFVIPVWIDYPIFAVVTVAALWKGDWRARLIQVARLLAFAFGTSVCARWACWGSDRPPLMAYRVLFDLSIVWLACLVSLRRTRRYWVLWANSFALVSVIAAAAGRLGLGLSEWAVGSAAIIFGYCLDAAILWGVRDNIRDRAAAKVEGGPQPVG